MRVGIADPKRIGVQKLATEIWDVIMPDLCEPVNWIPEPAWRTSNDEILSLLDSNQIDMLHDLYGMTNYRTEVIHFSYPISISQYVLMIPTSQLVVDDPDEWLIPKSSLAVFSIQVWLTIILTMLLLFLISWSLSRTTGVHRDPQPWSWFAHYWLQSTQSEATGTSMATKCLFVVTSFFTCHSLVLYQGCLLTELVRPSHFQAPFDTFDDVIRLVSQKSAILDLRIRNWPFPQIINHSHSAEYKKLSEALEDNPAIYSQDDGVQFSDSD